MPSPRRNPTSRTVTQVEALDDRFADNLRAARETAGISRVELSRRTGMSWQSIEKIETARGRHGLRRRVTIGEAVVLAEALGVKPGELLRGAAEVAHA